MKRFAALMLAVALSGCGGGGSSSAPGGGTPTLTPTPAPTPAGGASLCNSAGTLCWPSATPSAVATAAAKPRIILTVMLDDADYNDFGYHSTDAVTPNIDAIAKQGVVLSRYYSASAVCSPTRASFLTGREPAHFGLNYLWEDLGRIVNGQYFIGLRGIPAGQTTLPAMLGAQGYRSLHMGKWHIGSAADRFLPKAKGFDSYEIPRHLPVSGSIRLRTHTGDKTISTQWRPQYEADRIISFIDDNLKDGQNVYVNWWPYEPHIIPEGDKTYYYVPPTFDQAAFDAAGAGKSALNLTTDRGKLLAMMFAFDAQFGRVVDHLKQKGLFDDSLIIVTSDNGGHTTALSPTRVINGSKATVREGGVRVPFAASWPKRFKPGTHSSLPVVSTDLLPTIAGLIGAPAPNGVDGSDASPVLLTGTGTRPPIYFQMRKVAIRNSHDDKYDDIYALLDGCDKLVHESNREWLFDVCVDPLEKADLATSKAARFSQLRSQFRDRRLKAALYTSLASVTSSRTFPADDRLDIHEDDLSVYATVNVTAAAAAGTHSIYRRGDLTLKIVDGTLVANLTGAADTTLLPAMRAVELTAAIPKDGKDHRIGFVIRGYYLSGSTVRLFVDGQIAAEASAPLAQGHQAGTSVMAVKSESTPMRLGDDLLPLKDVEVYVNAIEPSEF